MSLLSIEEAATRISIKKKSLHTGCRATGGTLAMIFGNLLDLVRLGGFNIDAR